MKRRQIVLQTLEPGETDIIPYQIDLTEDSRSRLQNYYGRKDIDDILHNFLAKERNESFERVSADRVRDMFGVEWLELETGDFGTVTNQIFSEPDLRDYQFPAPDRELIKKKCRSLEEESGERFTMYTIGFSLFERAWTMRGMENLLRDFVENPGFVRKLMARITGYNKEVMAEVSRYDVDCIFFGDDWGMQRGLIMGPKYWRKHIKPHLEEMYRFARERGFFIAQHSCGDIEAIFSDLVELGLDIYNTFQPEIFDVLEMKEKFGDEITFYGGISTQKVLPQGSPAGVKEETEWMMENMSRGGGYIAAPTHDIPADVPLENMLAFIEAVQKQTGLKEKLNS